MKKYLNISLLMVLVALFGSAFAQQENLSGPCSESERLFREEMNRLDEYCKSFNPDANMPKSDVWYEPSDITMFGVDGNPMAKYEWTYVDANNDLLRNISTEVLYTFKGDALVNDTRRMMSYDEKGNWVACLTEIWDGTTWVNDYRFACTYDENNNMTFQTQDKRVDGEWIGVVRWTNTWDASNRLLDRMFERVAANLGTWEQSTHQTWSYDENGNMLSEFIYSRKPDGSWTSGDGWEYAYDELGNRIQGVYTYQGVYNGRDTYTYDENKNQLSQVREKYEDNKFVNYWRNFWTYDNENNKITQTYERFENEEWVFYTRAFWSFDGNGNKVEWIAEDLIDGDWICTLEAIYTYDANNKLLELSQKVGDDDGGELVDNWHEVYTYDESGNKLTELIELYMDDAWITLADYAWTYDDHGNSTIFEAAMVQDKMPLYAYYNDGLSTYGLPYYMVKLASINYVNIKSTISVENISLNETSIKLDVKGTFQLEAIIEPANATTKNVIWSSSDENIATVSSEGLVIAKKDGSAVITATTVEGGLTATCNVVVNPVGVDEINNDNIKVYYSNHTIIINSNVDIQNVSVSDITGRIVHQANNTKAIETSSWNAGIYIVSTTTNNNVVKAHKIYVK